ncbi:MAG: ArsR/SmtB family transcription factor [Candidatus Sericytochromatia bacterium]
MSVTPMRIFKADFFKALSSPVRIAILDLLRNGEKSVNELTASFEIEQVGISQHLSVLRTKNLVKTRKVGNNVYYSILDPSVFMLLDEAARIYQHNLIDLHQMNAPILG